MYNELDSIYENMYEYYINDYIIFEGILRKDYLECIGILNENTVTNFFKSIWEKILKILKTVKEKIFGKKNKDNDTSTDNKDETVTIKGNKLSVAELLKKYENFSSNDKDKLKNLKVSGHRALPDNEISIFKKVTGIIDYYTDSIEKLFPPESFVNNIDQNLKICEEINNIDIREKKKEIKQLIYNSKFSSNDIEYPFRTVPDMRTFLYITDQCIKEGENLLKEYREYLPRFIQSTEAYIRKITNMRDNVDSDTYKKQIFACTKLLKTLNIISNILIYSYETLNNYNNKVRKQYIKLLVTAINHIEKTQYNVDESYISDEYNDILSEATLYELGL